MLLDGDRRVSVTRVAVCMEEKGTGMQTGYMGGIQSVSESGNENRYT